MKGERSENERVVGIEKENDDVDDDDDDEEENVIDKKT